MKKIAVITLHAVKNYGSVLQTYATQQVLKKLGYEVEIINYIRAFNLDENIADKVTEKDHGLKKIAKKFALIPTVYRWKKIFNSFLYENINLSKKVYTYDDDFKISPINADIFCVGSDQVWNTEWNDGVTGPLYLNFVHNVPKIAFASSVGVDSYDEKHAKVIGAMLNDFYGITVRERSSIDLLQSITEHKVMYCCDPTLLLDSLFWRKFYNGVKKVNEPYILLIQLNHNSAFDNYAVAIAKKKKMKLVRLCMRYDQTRLPGRAIIIPKVSEYLSLIDNANLILTDSFHATVFSINFNKDFLSIYPGNFNSRIEDILQNCELTERRLLSFDDYEIVDNHINYDLVNKKLKTIRQESTENIANLLGNLENVRF